MAQYQRIFSVRLFCVGLLLPWVSLLAQGYDIELNEGDTKDLSAAETVNQSILLNGGTGTFSNGGTYLGLVLTMGTTDGTTIKQTCAARTALVSTLTNPGDTAGKTLYLSIADTTDYQQCLLLNTDKTGWSDWKGTFAFTSGWGGVYKPGSNQLANATVTLQDTCRGFVLWNTPNISIGMLTSALSTAELELHLASSTLTVGENNASGTFAGILKNNGANVLSITKAGTGTWTLSGANTYTGLTTISDGAIEITGSAAYNGGFTLNGGDLTIRNGAAVTTTGVTTLTNGTLSISEGGSFTTTATNNSVVVTKGNIEVGDHSTFTASGSGNILALNGGNIILGEGATFNANRIEVWNGSILMGAGSTLTASGGIPLYGDYDHGLSGTIVAPVTLGAGTLSPGGADVGKLEITGNLEIRSTLVFDVESADSFDILNHKGEGDQNVSFATGGTIEILSDDLLIGPVFDLLTTETEFLVNGSVPAADFDWDSLLVDPVTWNLTLTNLEGGGQMLSAQVDGAAVPEPCSGLLLLLGGLFLFWRKR
ncbi:MAG: autotransporter-associated beta strand repeat-containing protein [Planctomycetia bacterium]|nr:autotransporter-associated beta strand repeat-containing protein [Planctomycetia bacterium]